MPLTKKHINFSALILILSTCGELCYANINVQNSAKHLVFGQTEGYQIISASISFSVNKHKVTQTSSCSVRTYDNFGYILNLIKFEKGNYQIRLKNEQLKPETSCKVLTPSGEEITSDDEQMPKRSEIDSNFFIKERILTSNPLNIKQRMPLYIDIYGGNINREYHRWNTEHCAPYPILSSLLSHNYLFSNYAIS